MVMPESAENVVGTRVHLAVLDENGRPPTRPVDVAVPSHSGTNSYPAHMHAVMAKYDGASVDGKYSGRAYKMHVAAHRLAGKNVTEAWQDGDMSVDNVFQLVPAVDWSGDGKEILYCVMDSKGRFHRLSEATLDELFSMQTRNMTVGGTVTINGKHYLQVPPSVHVDFAQSIPSEDDVSAETVSSDDDDDDDDVVMDDMTLVRANNATRSSEARRGEMVTSMQASVALSTEPQSANPPPQGPLTVYEAAKVKSGEHRMHAMLTPGSVLKGFTKNHMVASIENFAVEEAKSRAKAADAAKKPPAPKKRAKPEPPTVAETTSTADPVEVMPVEAAPPPAKKQAVETVPSPAKKRPAPAKQMSPPAKKQAVETVLPPVKKRAVEAPPAKMNGTSQPRLLTYLRDRCAALATKAREYARSHDVDPAAILPHPFLRAEPEEARLLAAVLGAWQRALVAGHANTVDVSAGIVVNGQAYNEPIDAETARKASMCFYLDVAAALPELNFECHLTDPPPAPPPAMPETSDPTDW